MLRRHPCIFWMLIGIASTPGGASARTNKPQAQYILVSL